MGMINGGGERVGWIRPDQVGGPEDGQVLCCAPSPGMLGDGMQMQEEAPSSTLEVKAR